MDKSNSDPLDHYYAVIMAGGGGTRLWPLSRQSRPKQMLSLFDERTLFQTSVQRLVGLFPFERIFVVTVEEQAKELQSQVPQIPINNFIIEPLPRGTASVIGLAAIVLQKKDPDAVMAILTSDHFIGNELLFREFLRTALDVAMDDQLVTLGIVPNFPATGFGYVQTGGFLKNYNGHDVFRVLKFKEKPTEPQAQLMLDQGGHFWNSGMFVWKVGRILQEFERQMPDLAAGLMEIGLAYNSPPGKLTLERIWSEVKVETIDYGIMEGANSVAVVPAAGLEWNDVGSWDSLFEVIPGDKDGNIVIGGTHIGLDTQQSLIYMNQDRRLIVTIGINDLILVDTGDVILVCRKDQAQRVRQVVNQLRQNGLEYV
jgi:mannose-1-phosphate guanylyltransferase